MVEVTNVRILSRHMHDKDGSLVVTDFTNNIYRF